MGKIERKVDPPANASSNCSLGVTHPAFSSIHVLGCAEEVITDVSAVLESAIPRGDDPLASAGWEESQGVTEDGAVSGAPAESYTQLAYEHDIQEQACDRLTASYPPEYLSLYTRGSLGIHSPGFEESGYPSHPVGGSISCLLTHADVSCLRDP